MPSAAMHDCSCFSPMAQVISVINSLYDANFRPLGNMLAIYTDHGCDLRVYVNRAGSSPGFRHKTLKNMLKFFVMFEAQIDSILPNVDRIRRGALDALSCEKSLHLAWDSTALLAIGSRLATTHSAINIARAIYEEGKAFEFLQHPATLDFQEAMAWINTCVGIVAWLETSAYGAAYCYMANRWYDVQYSFPDILADINVDSQAVEHYKNVLLYGTEHTYERKKYERTVIEVQSHPLRDLLVDVALQRYKKANRYTVGMAVLEKILHGEYGWLPAGSPIHLPDLPIVSVEDGVSYLTCPADKEFPRWNTVAIKNLPFGIVKWQLVKLMADDTLPIPIRLTFLRQANRFIGVAFAEYHDSADAARTIASMNQIAMCGRDVVAEWKTPRTDGNLIYRNDRRRRLYSGAGSSTEYGTRSFAASASTGDADASSEHTDQSSILAEAGAESHVSGESDFHSCLEWPSPEL